MPGPKIFKKIKKFLKFRHCDMLITSLHTQFMGFNID